MSTPFKGKRKVIMDIVLVDCRNSIWFSAMLPSVHTRLLQCDKEVFALGAVQDGVACGILLCRYNTLYLDIIYLVIADSYRRRGIAAGLVRYLCSLAGRHHLPVSCYFSAEDEQDEIYRFFDSLPSFHITCDEDMTGELLPYSMLMDSQVLNSLKKPERRACHFFELSGIDQRTVLHKLRKNGIYYLEDFGENKERYIPPLCLFQHSRGEITAALFMERYEETEDILLSFAYSTGSGVRSLMELFLEAREYIVRTAGRNVAIHIDTVNMASYRLLHKLYPACIVTGEKLYIAQWDMI